MKEKEQQSDIKEGKENSGEIPIEVVDENASKSGEQVKQNSEETAQTESKAKANDAVKEVVKPASDGNKKQSGPKFKKGGKKKNQQTGRPKPQEDSESSVSQSPIPPEESDEAVQEQKPSQETATQEKTQDIPKEAAKAEDTEEKLADNKKEAEPEVENLEGTVEPTEEDVTEKDAAENPEDASSEDVMQKMTPKDKAASDEAAKWKEAAEEAQDKYKRLLAEFENARAREAKEAAQKYDLGAKTVLEKLLPVVDNFERAIQTIPEEDRERAFEQGVDKIYKQMMTVLEDIGVQPMNAEGTEFNPDLHNAVMHIEDESLGENVVAEEMQKGYMYKDSVLRYSMVKVAN
ncbi:MAG: nucleotide exchange factor GrpE [Lachnospiraceae bacterium]|nr:nucleotide exchange factor GrpE [Lachnospiraceae bacterium]